MVTEINNRQIGVNLRNGHTSIRVWAPLANSVAIQFNDEEPLHLHKEDYGYWQLEEPGSREGDTYRFILNGAQPLPDPASLSQPAGVHGPSQVVNLHSYTWQDETWNNYPLERYILYELHTGTFSAEGNLEAIIERLDYLKDLGITAIELMPLAQFPGERNWGYDGVFPFAVQNSYGGAKALQTLVDACHAKGLAVVLDVVYNHLGPEGNYLSSFGPYFTDKYSTPWGSAVNFDDAWCGGVRDYFIENVLMWFRDFHIDALRMDAVHAIKDFGPKHILREIKEAVDMLMQTTGRRHYLIVECDLNDTKYINTIDDLGYGMDAQWIDEFHHALRVAAGQEKTGYYADFEGIRHLAKAYEDAYVYNGQYSPHRNKHFGTHTDNAGHQFVVFAQNHDQVGNRMLGERLTELVSFGMQKTMAAAVILSPYLPMLWMGEEYREPNPFLYFVSHSEPQLVEAVRKGRKAEFADFHAAGEAPDPQSEETFKHSKLRWELTGQEPHATMLRFYKALIQLRTSDPVFSALERSSLTATADETNNVLILHRWKDETHRLVLLNFSARTQEITLPDTNMQWQLLFNSSDRRWGGNSPDPGSHRITITAPPESALIYANNQDYV